MAKNSKNTSKRGRRTSKTTKEVVETKVEETKQAEEQTGQEQTAVENREESTENKESQKVIEVTSELNIGDKADAVILGDEVILDKIDKKPKSGRIKLVKEIVKVFNINTRQFSNISNRVLVMTSENIYYLPVKSENVRLKDYYENLLEVVGIRHGRMKVRPRAGTVQINDGDEIFEYLT